MNQSQKFAPRPPQSGLSDRPGPCPSSLKASAAFNHAQMYDARRAGQPVWGCERHAPGRVDWDSVVILTRARCDRKPPVLTLPVNLGRRFGVGSLFPSISFGCSLADGYRSRRHFPSRFADRRQSHSKSPSLNGSHRTERLPKEIHAASHVAKRLSGGNVYRCPHCNNWHVGHKAPRPPVGPKRRAFVQPDDLDI
jgi:hypothetical protein